MVRYLWEAGEAHCTRVHDQLPEEPEDIRRHKASQRVQDTVDDDEKWEANSVKVLFIVFGYLD